MTARATRIDGASAELVLRALLAEIDEHPTFKVWAHGRPSVARLVGLVREVLAGAQVSMFACDSGGTHRWAGPFLAGEPFSCRVCRGRGGIVLP